MAERRMFAKTIIDSDAFLDMPLSAQALYFHLSMRADDEGFVNNPKRVQRMIGASDDDLKLLIMKRFILAFDSGVIVIKHWRIHNYIAKDRFTPTVYKEERGELQLDEKNAYTELKNVPYTACIQDVYETDTQDRLDKDSIVKDIYINGATYETPESEKTRRFIIPTIEEIKAYCEERGNNVDAERFHAYYSSNGWRVGKNKMKDWRAAVRTWERNGIDKKERETGTLEFDMSDYYEIPEVRE